MAKKSVASANMTYENDNVKFNYPVNLKIKNKTTNGFLDIRFYNGTTD